MHRQRRAIRGGNLGGSGRRARGKSESASRRNTVLELGKEIPIDCTISKGS